MALCNTASSAVLVWEFLMIASSGRQLSASLVVCSQSQLVRVCSVMVRYNLQQHILVFLYDAYTKYGSARKCPRKFRDSRVPSRQTIHNLVNKTRNKNISSQCLLRRT
jgi:hypothetical protein